MTNSALEDFPTRRRLSRTMEELLAANPGRNVADLLATAVLLTFDKPLEDLSPAEHATAEAFVRDYHDLLDEMTEPPAA